MGMLLPISVPKYQCFFKYENWDFMRIYSTMKLFHNFTFVLTQKMWEIILIFQIRPVITYSYILILFATFCLFKYIIYEPSKTYLIVWYLF